MNYRYQAALERLSTLHFNLLMLRLGVKLK